MKKANCLELGLLEPLSYESQKQYVLRLMLNGFRFNTRQARYIGIANLHSVLSDIKKGGVKFTTIHELVRCPDEGNVPPFRVDVAFMRPEQIKFYQETRKRKTA